MAQLKTLAARLDAAREELGGRLRAAQRERQAKETEAEALAARLAETARQPVETAAFVVVAQLATPSSHGGKRWLGAAPHTQEEPLSHRVCSRWLGCPS